MEVKCRITGVGGESLAGATLQVLNPDGSNYWSPRIADANGVADGRCPDQSYSWLITYAGYNSLNVPLTACKGDDTDYVTVQLEPNNGMLDDFVFTAPAKNKLSAIFPWLLIGGIALVFAKKSR